MRINLVLDSNCTLAIQCENNFFKDWLDTRLPGVTRQKIVQPILDRAKAKLSSNEWLQYQDDGICSLVLADKSLNLSVVKNTIAVTFYDKVVNDKQPYIVLSQFEDKAVLVDQVLLVPSKDQPSHNTTNLFCDLNSSKVWVEEEGPMQGYFEHQTISLPVKMLRETKSGWIQNLPALQQPNLDTLAFMANYFPENEIVAKLPLLSFSQVVEFQQKIAHSWNGKKFSPSALAEKVFLLSDNEELSEFSQLFPNMQLRLSQLHEILQGQQLDEAFKNLKLQAAKFSEFSDLLKISTELAKLDVETLPLNLINSGTLDKLTDWEKNKRN